MDYPYYLIFSTGAFALKIISPTKCLRVDYSENNISPQIAIEGESIINSWTNNQDFKRCTEEDFYKKFNQVQSLINQEL